jgi:DNA polymerase III subunit epsilon
MPDQPWTDAPLIAFDLEGTGAQDRGDEAILEVGVVPLDGGRPHMAGGFHSPVNPGRRIPRRPWISPGLTDDTLAAAPSLDVIATELADRLDGAYIVGHNVGVDWRLLSARCPGIRPAALIDTLKLARLARTGTPGRSLTSLLGHYGLTEEVTRLTGGGQPHRALWDATGAALLLPTLIGELLHGAHLSVAGLRRAAGLPLNESQADGPEKLNLLF